MNVCATVRAIILKHPFLTDTMLVGNCKLITETQ